MAKNKSLSMVSKGLRYKLKISFYLMSILPLLVCIYLVSNYILPFGGLKIDIALSIAISIFIAVIGFFVVKEVFDHILAVSKDARIIASGDINHKIGPVAEDEVGDLTDALNQLTQRIRTNMDELKNYGERTTQINLEIQKRVLVLSSLLQISSLISQGSRLEDILRVTTEKARLLANSVSAYLLFREEGIETFSMKAADGLNALGLLRIEVQPQEIFEKSIKAKSSFILDSNNPLPKEGSVKFQERFGFKNSLAQPVYLKGRLAGLLGIGNSQDGFVYAKEDIELLDIFAKQISIAIENDILMHRVEKLEIKDALTGLYNEAFIRTRLQEEIKRAIAYQRPCGFILLNIANFKEFHQNFGSLQAEALLKKVATLIKDSISEVDRAARFSDNTFAIVLPEKNKRRVEVMADKITKAIEFAFSEEPDSRKRIKITRGVSENPLDGVEAGDLIQRAIGEIKQT